MEKGKLSVPLTLIGVGAVITVYNPVNLRFAGYLSISAGFMMLAINME